MPRTPLAKSTVDVEVGARIRARRKLLGLSQSALGERLGITFQQVQKYEKGSNRVGSSRLQSIALVLGTTPAALFGEEGPIADTLEVAVVERMLTSPDGVALSKAFVQIRDLRSRRAIINLVKSLAADNSE